MATKAKRSRPRSRCLPIDFHDLMKNIKSFSDGQAAVTRYDEENLGNFGVTISPYGGFYYKEGEFDFEIVMHESCDILPSVNCKTAIYHPNIDTIEDPDGGICINLLDTDVWTSDTSMQDIVQGLLFLMYNPNLEDPLCDVVYSKNMKEFGRDVEKSIAGGRIGDYQFPVNARYARLHPDRNEMEDMEGVHMVDIYFGIKQYIHVHVGVSDRLPDEHDDEGDDEENYSDNSDFPDSFDESDGSDSVKSCSKEVYRPASTRVHDDEENYSVNCEFPHFVEASSGTDSSSEMVYSPPPTRVHDDEGNYSDNSDFFEACDGSDSSNSSSKKVYRPASTKVHNDKTKNLILDLLGESDGSDSSNSSSEKVYRSASTKVHNDKTENLILDLLGESDGSDSSNSSSEKVYRPASTRVHDEAKENYADDETEDL